MKTIVIVIIYEKKKYSKISRRVNNISFQVNVSPNLSGMFGANMDVNLRKLLASIGTVGTFEARGLTTLIKYMSF